MGWRFNEERADDTAIAFVSFMASLSETKFSLIIPAKSKVKQYFLEQMATSTEQEIAALKSLLRERDHAIKEKEKQIDDVKRKAKEFLSKKMAEGTEEKRKFATKLSTVQASMQTSKIMVLFVSFLL
jgi:septal ring factor EnvC (AmiA/AmiB activator)